MKLTIEFARDQGVTVDGMRIEQAPPDLIRALQAAHARDHELVGQITALQEHLEKTAELLRTRTIERDHHATDAHLWSCCLAYIVERDGDSDGELVLPVADVNAQEEKMIAARVDDDGGLVHITIGPRPQASEEGRGG